MSFTIQKDRIELIESFDLTSLPAASPAWDWSRGMTTSMQVGGSASVRAFVNCKAIAGTAQSVTCKVQTSPDGTTWDDCTAVFPALTAAATLEQAALAGVSKPMKFLRLVVTVIGDPDNTGVLQWGLF